MLLEAKGREVDTSSEHPGLGQNANTADAVNLHFHIRVAIRISQIGKMRPPCRILRVAFHNDCVFIQGIC